MQLLKLKSFLPFNNSRISKRQKGYRHAKCLPYREPNAYKKDSTQNLLQGVQATAVDVYSMYTYSSRFTYLVDFPVLKLCITNFLTVC